MRVWILILALLAGPVAVAEPKGDCGTIVLPSGGGDGPSADITSFSPIYSDTAYNQEAAWMLFPDLLWMNRFSQIDWSRSLATAVTTTDDTTFTVTMRPWHWSDGQPLTAGDAVYYFELIKALGNDWVDYGAGGLPYIVKSVKILSDQQFQITTVHPVNPTWFIYNAISQLQPLPRHIWSKYTLDQIYQLQSTPSFYDVVDGPVKIERLDVGLDAVFVPNPAWEGPKMHFSRLVFKFLEGDGAAVQGVESGDTDDAELPTDLVDAVKGMPGMYVVTLQQTAYQNVLNINYQNHDMAFFKDVRVRQAMIDSIDQEAIVNGLEHGHGDPAYGPVPRSMTAFLTPAMRAGIYPVGYDPARSRQLLAEAGFTPGPDGIMQKDGKRLEFTYLEETGTNAVTELDETLQSDFRKVGIDMKIRLMEFNQMLALMAGSPQGWDITGTGLGIQNYPSGEAQFETGAFQNMGAYSDPKMDKLIDASVNKPGLDGLFAYETYASAQQPVIFGPRERPVILVSDRLHGISDFLDPNTMMAPDQLYCTVGAGAEK